MPGGRWAWSGRPPASGFSVQCLLGSASVLQAERQPLSLTVRYAIVWKHYKLFCCRWVFRCLSSGTDSDLQQEPRLHRGRQGQPRRGEGGVAPACSLPAAGAQGPTGGHGSQAWVWRVCGLSRQVQACSGARTRGWRLPELCWTTDGKLQPCSREPRARCRLPKAKAAPPRPAAPGSLLPGPPLPWLRGVSALSWQTLQLQHSRQIVTASKGHSRGSETFREQWEVKQGLQSCTAKSPLGILGSQ